MLTATPLRALMDEQISIIGRFLTPQCPVTVCAQMHSDDGDLWEAFAHYNTNADGTVNLTRDRSVGGSYLGCEPMGLFWGLQPAPGSREGLRLRKKNVETPYVMLMSLLEGHVSPSEKQSTELAAVIAERWYMAPGVRRIEIRKDGVVGTLFLPPGPGPFPAMLDLWGMGGGLMEYRSALFASKGYASFSLAYFGHKDLSGPEKSVNVGLQNIKTICILIREPLLQNDILCFLQMENLACPLMYIVGEDDQNTSSIENANMVDETLRAAGKSQLLTLLSYPGAGHLIEPPYTPNARRSLWKNVTKYYHLRCRKIERQ
uniref:Acyl-coenzyme A thioesterase 4-like n=1 Tax=Cyclopterus lumpus TaxID=8103 RepID=A0A8C2XR61_CYCLU